MLQVLRQHAEAPAPPLPDEVRSQIPAALETLLLSLLEKAPQDRPASASAVVQTLEALAPAASARTARATFPTAASCAAVSAAAPSAVQPRALVRAFPTSPGKKADTIALLDRFEKKKRWPWIAGAAALAIGIAIAVPWALGLQENERPAKKKSKTTANAAPTVPAVPSFVLPAPVDIAAESCKRAEMCGPFNPETPSSLEAETVIARADQFVRGVDASARLMSAHFAKVLVNGRIDLTRPNASIDFTYATANGQINLRVSITHFTGRRSTFTSQPKLLPAVPCTLKRAFDAALGAGFPFNDTSSANLVADIFSPLGEWRFRSESGGFVQAADADAASCAVEFKPKKLQPGR